MQDKKLSLNDFVDSLVKNHLSDRLFWIRKKNYLKKIILSVIFFLTDEKYNWIEYYHRSNKLQEDKINDREEKEPKISSEPFFKYFKIHNNALFVLFVILFFVLIIIKKYKFFDEQNISTSNPILLSAFIIILFLFHYFSSFLHLKKRDKNGFIYKLHNSSLNGSFKLRIKKPQGIKR
ncbi:MAG: hypothetical protein QMC93_03505 [Patescibacteria group bacterium]|nr:hypothetical protein [Patescibacteria group bacterium]